MLERTMRQRWTTHIAILSETTEVTDVICLRMNKWKLSMLWWMTGETGMKVVPRKHTKIPTLKQEGLLRHKNLHARPWKECWDCPDWPHVKEAKMSFGHLKKRGKRKIEQYTFLYCCEAHCLSCAARCVAEYALKPASCLSCHGWPEMGKASRTSCFATVACAALGSQASASNSAERPPTQTRQHKKHTQKYTRHKHKHKNANTNKKR